MTKVLWALTGVLLSISEIPGQDVSTLDRLARSYQVFGPAIGGRALDEGFDNRVVRGKPFSATEERRSNQILGDGTRIETSQTNRVFRDSEGRTRVEEMNGTATIFDPIANFRMEVNPTAKTTRRVNSLALVSALRVGAPGTPATTQGVMTETTENLKPQMVNGVMAQGVRTTMTIPKGEIGNDREIKVVTERWVSNDLQMLIKSTNSDPRFGATSYQLTGIVEREPDAGLFKIPDGYTEVGGGARGGSRSPVPAGVIGTKAGAPAGRTGARGVAPSPAPQQQQ